jgi:DNA end-binding protein Ku
LSFGLVAIPVEIHSAVKDESISFHLLHAECGSRIRNRRFCPVCNKPLESEELVRGYEIEKGRYVRVTDAELDELEAESNSSIDLREFIPIAKVDPVYFERAYYLGADEGGGKALPWRKVAG